MADAEFGWSDQAGAAAQAYQEFFVPGMFTPFAEKLLADAGVAQGGRVLDVACGTGVVSRMAARLVGEGGSVTGVDLTEPMLAVARAQPTDEGAARIDFVAGDAAALPVDDDSFDFVTCHHGLQFFPEKVAALAEARRALVDGGVLAVGCWGEPDGVPAMKALIDALTRHMGEDIGNAMQAPFSIGGRDALRQLVEEAGFAEVDAHLDTLDAEWPSRADFAPRALAAGPLAEAFGSAPAETRDAITRDVAAALEPYATGEDRLRAPMTSCVAIARA